jgi:hypothetical protein
VLKVADISTIMGYGISGLMGVVGILVLSGILVTESMPIHLRVLFGIVLVLYSVYRFMMTRTRAKQVERSDE